VVWNRVETYTVAVVWILAAAVFILGFYRFFQEPSRHARALNFSVMHARNQKNWELAAKFGQRSHEEAGKLKEPGRSQLESEIEMQWAEVLYRMGELGQAEDMVRHAISKAERHFAPQSEMIIKGYICWGDICTDQDRHAEAEGHYRKALASETEGNIAGLIFDLERLGDCLIRQGRRADAEQVIEQAIALETMHGREFLAAQGLDPAGYRMSPSSLPDLSFCREQYEEAQRLYREKSQHWDSQEQRPGNIDLGQLLMQLGLSEERAGHYGEAIQSYQRAAAEFERDWCLDHPKAVAARRAVAALSPAAEQLQSQE